MKTTQLEPCLESPKSELQIILELQKELCDYEWFMGDLLFDLFDKRFNSHQQYSARMPSVLLDELRKALPAYNKL